MTNGEYQQLVEFLGQKFGEVDRQFSEVSRQFGEVNRQFSEVNRQLVEVRRDIAVVQEGLAETRGELGAFRQETRREFDDVRALIRLSYADLDRRVQRLEGER